MQSENELTKKQIREFLSSELKGSQKILNDLRRERLDKTLSAIEKRDKFSIRIGELSLAIAAALTPILVIAGQPISNKEYLIIGLLIYLVTGLVTIFNTKRCLEDELDTISSMGIDLERDVERINHITSKLIFDPDNSTYKQEYVKNTKEFIRNLTTIKKRSDNINYYLDFITVGFLIATISCARAVWSFSEISYWITASLFLVGLIIVTIKSAFKAKERQLGKNYLQKELDKENNEYTDWYSKNVLKDER
ncbi:MAG: hypothetical protein US49_C0020G0002 [candidate division TM6 bacterium GW2011_GWF2_37_49]|nr:MAG: hypothetical protein US49_C0020G0002 [candidate division TM6 bacterium GW2011_GWF2_37_49]